MIKKIFHLVFAILFCALFSAFLGLLYMYIFWYTYHIDIASAKTYQMFSNFWNHGGIIKGKDFTMLLLLFSYIPFCLFMWYKIFHYKFLNLFLVPIVWLQNRALKNYKVNDVNIKNLALEEKKTIEQLVQERIEI